MDNFVINRKVKAHAVAKDTTVVDYEITPKNKKPMQAHEVRKLARILLDRAKAKNPNAKLSITASNVLNDAWTLKSFQNSIDTILDDDDYFAGRVKDTSNFNEYYRMNFHIVY
jgi:hypothetical protein